LEKELSNMVNNRFATQRDDEFQAEINALKQKVQDLDISLKQTAFEKAKLIRSHGFNPMNRYWHLTWGTNMRLTNIQAAIGVGQMERIHELVGAKKRVAKNYDELISANLASHVRKRSTLASGEDSYWLYVIEFLQKIDLDDLVEYLSQRKIETRRIFPPLNQQPAFKGYVSPTATFPISEERYNSGICLPSSTNLSLVDQVKVIDGIKNFFLRFTNLDTVEMVRN
jgi:dTDP-4-amino-4,6-dideoxygalactose transaminase